MTLEPCPVCGKPRIAGTVHVKCATLRVSGIYVRTQQFDWESEDHKRRITFDVGRMLRDIANGKLRFERAESQLDRQWVEQWLVPCREPNLRYARNLKSGRLNEPVLGVDMGDNSTLLVDGTHRYLGRYIFFFETVRWHLVAFKDWQPYAVETKL